MVVGYDGAIAIMTSGSHGESVCGNDRELFAPVTRLYMVVHNTGYDVSLEWQYDTREQGALCVCNQVIGFYSRLLAVQSS